MTKQNLSQGFKSDLTFERQSIHQEDKTQVSYDRNYTDEEKSTLIISTLDKLRLREEPVL